MDNVNLDGVGAEDINSDPFVNSDRLADQEFDFPVLDERELQLDGRGGIRGVMETSEHPFDLDNPPTLTDEHAVDFGIALDVVNKRAEFEARSQEEIDHFLSEGMPSALKKGMPSELDNEEVKRTVLKGIASALESNIGPDWVEFIGLLNEPWRDTKETAMKCAKDGNWDKLVSKVLDNLLGESLNN